MISPTVASVADNIHHLAKVPRAELVELLAAFDGDIMEDIAAAFERILKEVNDREDCEMARKVVDGKIPNVRTERELSRRRSDLHPFLVELRNTGGGRNAFYRVSGRHDGYAWNTSITYGRIGTDGRTIDGRSDHVFEKIKDKLGEGYVIWTGEET